MKFYGWIGKSNPPKIRKRDKGTDTASYIKYFSVKQIGARVAKIEGINSTNILEKDESYYYVLSIGYEQKAWAPYPFIYDLAKRHSYMLLTIDGVNKGEGKIYKVELSDEKIKELDMTRVERKGAGDYYPLPLSKVKDKMLMSAEYTMNDSESDNYITKVLNNLMQ